LLLACGDLEVVLYIADGGETAERIVEQAEPLTRGNTDSLRARPIEPVNGSALLIGREPPIESSRERCKARRLESTPDAEMKPNDELAGKAYELTLPQMIIGRTDRRFRDA
jgi:hypothetical protein